MTVIYPRTPEYAALGISRKRFGELSLIEIEYRFYAYPFPPLKIPVEER